MRKTRKMQAIITRIAKQHDLDLAQVGAHLRIENEPYMPLVIECIGKNLVSVAHYYTQNGDAIADPDVVFLVGCDGEWYPFEWQMPYPGGYQQFVGVNSETGTWEWVKPRGQRGLAIFANKWADNIRRQGFAEA